MLLAVGQDLDQREAFAEGRAHALEVQRRHRGVADHRDAAARHVAQQQRGIAQQAGTDVDRITAIVQTDFEDFCRHVRRWRPCALRGTPRGAPRTQA